MSKTKRAFTLIELLIVVAIIAILAAIAVPNCLEAQVRAKVTRVKADLRSLATALETYAVDHNNFPANTQCDYIVALMCMLTTPSAYITSVAMEDSFTPDTGEIYHDFAGRSAPIGKSYTYCAYYGPWLQTAYPHFRQNERRAAVIHGYGPSRWRVDLHHYPGLNLWAPDHVHSQWDTPGGRIAASPQWINIVYDLTNGTKRFGGIGRVVGDLECEKKPRRLSASAQSRVPARWAQALVLLCG